MGKKIDITKSNIIKPKDSNLTRPEEPNLNGVLRFDVERVVVPVEINSKDGTVKHYELKEATGDAECRWRNAMLAKTKLGPGGKPETFSDLADTEPVLVALCLYPKGSDRNVDTKLVRSWPSRIQKTLFAKVKEISDIDEDDDDDDEDRDSVKN